MSSNTSLEKDADRVLRPLAEVTATRGLDQLASSLHELRHWLADDLQQLEQDLSTSVPELRTLSQKAAKHLIGQPGKRVRPLVTLLSSRMAGQTPAIAKDLAVACELTHAATLLHDDVLDEGTERRGAPTARVVYGNSASVLGGDHLLIEALRRVRRAPQIELLDRMLDVIDLMVFAEALQLAQRETFEPIRERYMEVANGKTAVLFAWGMYAGGLVGGLPQEHCERLASVGTDLGLAFQAVDDLLDLSENAHEIGKDVFADIRDGKLTLPLIIACESDPSLIEVLSRAAHEGVGLENADAQRALLDKVRATGCVDDTRAEAQRWSDRAIETLREIPPSEARDALEAVILTAVSRIF